MSSPTSPSFRSRNAKTIKVTRRKTHQRTSSEVSRLKQLFNINDEKKKKSSPNISLYSNSLPMPTILDPEALTAEERLSRQLYTPVKKVSPKSSHLFDHFIIVGLPNINSTTSEILYKYPDIPVEIPGIADFCFPSGEKQETILGDDCNSDVLALMHNQLYLKKPENSFVFQFTDEQSQVYYGICVHKQELLHELPSYVNSNNVANGVAVSTTRCYCLVTKYPFFRLFFDFLFSLFAIEQLIRLETREPSILQNEEEENELHDFEYSKFPKPKTLNIPRKQGLSKSDSYSLLPSFIPEEEPLPIPEDFVIPTKRTKTLNVKPALFFSTDSGRNRIPRAKSPTRRTQVPPPRFEKSPPRYEKSPPIQRANFVSKQFSETQVPARKTRFFGAIGINKSKEHGNQMKNSREEDDSPENQNIFHSFSDSLTPQHASYSSNDLTSLTSPRKPIEFNLDDIPMVNELKKPEPNKIQIILTDEEENILQISSPTRDIENNGVVEGKEETGNEQQSNHPCIKALDKFRTFNIPAKGERVSFLVSRYLNPLVFSRPFYGNEEFELFSEWSIPVTLFFSSFDNLCTLISAVLLEKQIIVVSSNLRVLSAVVLSFPPLIRPFTHKPVTIPMLPEKFSNFLEAPVPYVVGVVSLPPNLPVNDLVIYDVAKKTINSSEPIPKLPRMHELKHQCQSHLKRLNDSFGSEPPYKTSREQLGIIDNLCFAFRKYFKSLFVNFDDYTICNKSDPSNPITVFMKESFLADVEPASLPFLEPFVSTQAFFTYSDKRLRKKDQ